MCGELTNIDFSSYSRPELQALIRQTLPVVEIHTKAMQRLLNISNGRSETFSTCYPIQDFTEPATIAIANGNKLAQQEINEIDEDKFDVILDITTNSLRFRHAPLSHSELIPSPLENIGLMRGKFLSYMLENPGKSISMDNLHKFYTGTKELPSANALAKSMSILRKALGQTGTNNTYILSERTFDSNNCSYKTNTKWNYLVIKEQKN